MLIAYANILYESGALYQGILQAVMAVLCWREVQLLVCNRQCSQVHGKVACQPKQCSVRAVR